MNSDLFGAYSNTHYAIEPRGRSAIDIRIGQPSLETDALFALRDPPSVSIITSHNPRSQVLSDVENRRRNGLLRQEFHAKRRSIHLAKGQSPDGQWVEASWAVEDIPVKELRRIAIFHGQNAAVRIEQGSVAELVPIFDHLPIFAGSCDELMEVMKSQSLSAPDPMDWKRLWQLVITLDDGKLELPSLKPPPDFAEYRQTERDDPDRLRNLFHLNLKAIEGSLLHWDLARAAITQAMRWKSPASIERRVLFDLLEDSGLNVPIQTTRMELGIYGEYAS